jgi:hypothetical protein
MRLRGSNAPRRVLLGLFMVLGTAACGNDPVVIVETPAPGERAQIVLRSLSVAGGREVRQETLYDSLTARYTVLVCNDAPVGVPCTTLRIEREGTIVTPTVGALFAATNSSAFRALADRSTSSGSVTPPDYSVGSLVITRNSRRRTIAWDDRASLPAALLDFQCTLRSARGDLVLCD